MDGYEWFLLGGGLLLGFLVGVVFIGIQIEESVDDLGSAICEEQFGMDYKRYYNGELTCKNNVVAEKYDGLKIIHEFGD